MAKVPHAEAINKLSRPKGMHADTWRRMKDLLRLLSSYGANIYPTQRTLAHKLGTSQQVVQQLVVRAETEGYITRARRHLDHAWRPGTTYTLLLPDNESRQGNQTSSLSKKKRTTSSSSSSPSSRGKRGLASASPRPNRFPGVCYVCQQPIAAKEGTLHGPLPVHLHCEEKPMDRNWQRQQAEDLHGAPALGEDPEAPLPVHSPVISNPAAKLAHQFEDQWKELVRRHPDWRQYRWGKLGPAIGYIRSQFLSNEYSVDYVQAYFDEFFDELAYPNNTLFMRSGQTVWELFTGWWGRTPVPDPAIAQAEQAGIDAIVTDSQAKTARRKAAWDRIMAADEPDPEDLRIFRGMA